MEDPSEDVDDPDENGIDIKMSRVKATRMVGTSMSAKIPKSADTPPNYFMVGISK